MKKTTREWVGKAEDDYRLVRRIIDDADPFHDQVCFHCQQCTEKYLKALLEELGLSIPKIHNLDDLHSLLAPKHPSLRSFRRGLIFFSGFAVGVRYPGETARKRQAAGAFRWCDRVRTACRTLLRIRPARRP